LFVVTPAIYLVAAQAAVWTFNFQYLVSCIFFVGLGIGGEYSAMNSAINELIPSKIRGMVDLAINGTYWVGAMIGAILTIVFLDTAMFQINVGWRYPFSIASVLGVAVIIMRLFLPESPRWLILHGRIQEAEELVLDIERRCKESTGRDLEVLMRLLHTNYDNPLTRPVSPYLRRSQ
jgi:MFS family permease